MWLEIATRLNKSQTRVKKIQKIISWSLSAAGPTHQTKKSFFEDNSISGNQPNLINSANRQDIKSASAEELACPHRPLVKFPSHFLWQIYRKPVRHCYSSLTDLSIVFSKFSITCLQPVKEIKIFSWENPILYMGAFTSILSPDFLTHN